MHSEANKYLCLDGISRYGTNNYTVNVALLGQQPPRRRVCASDSQSPAKEAGSDVKSHPSDVKSPSSDSGSPESSLTIIKPSLTRELSSKDIEKANKKVDFILENERKALDSWPGRASIPEPIRDLLDVYVQITGQKPAKNKLMDWLQTGQEWLEIGISSEDLQAAYKKAKPDCGDGFMVSRPGSLTTVAGMFAGERRKKPSTSRIVISAPPERKNEYVSIDLDKLTKETA